MWVELEDLITMTGGSVRRFADSKTWSIIKGRNTIQSAPKATQEQFVAFALEVILRDWGREVVTDA